LISIPLPVLVLPWLLALGTWLAFPWLVARVGNATRIRWLPPAFVVVGGALLWLSTGEDAGGHDAAARPMQSAAVALCEASAALPDDRDAAVRSFTDGAHEQLHLLAADPGLDRALAGDVLRRKQTVEALIAARASGEELSEPIAALGEATRAALGDLDIRTDPCAR
jgi:hypothetical protein